MIHTSITVGITTGEYKALQWVTADQQAWLENAIQNRARIAIEDITNKYTTFKIQRGEAITAIGTTSIIPIEVKMNIRSRLMDHRRNGDVFCKRMFP